MMEDEQPSQYTYGYFIVAKWIEVYSLGETYRYFYLAGVIDTETSYNYISKLTRLWGDLWPEIEGRQDLKLNDQTSFQEEFQKFQKYYYDPRQILATDPEEATRLADEIYKLEQVLRIAMAKLHYTTGMR